MNKLRLLGTVYASLSVLMLCALTISHAHAALLLDAGPSSINQLFVQGDYVAGTEFSVATAITMDGLGYLDAEGNGLDGSHEVGLWSVATQALLASTTITPGSATAASAHGMAQWFLEAINPVELTQGLYRVAGLVNNVDLFALSNDKIGNGVTLTSGYVRSDFLSGGFNYPDMSFDSEAIRVTVTTDMFSAPVPAPAAIWLFGSGLLGLIGISRRKKSA